VVLGSEAREPMQRSPAVATPDALPRFPYAPGGAASVVLGGDAPHALGAVRGPVGGADTVVLGEESGQEAYGEYVKRHLQLVQTPEPAPRFSQAPGGTSSFAFSAGAGVVPPLPSRGPVGGADGVVLGLDDGKRAFEEAHASREAKVETPGPAPRFQQAPGGRATVVLGGEEPAEAPAASRRSAPGGASTLVLGGEYPHEMLEKISASAFANGTNQNSGNVLTERSTTRVKYAPGGASTLVLGSEPAPAAEGASPGVSASKLGTTQSSGNTTERSATRMHQSPGGNSTLVLGGGYPHDLVEARKSENKGDACGSPPPLPRYAHRQPLQSPGGNSTISLADGHAEVDSITTMASANAFATGSNQNAGNTITDRRITRVQQAPGGTSTVRLGGTDENVDPTNKMQVDDKDTLKKGVVSTTRSASPPAAALTPVS